MFASRLGKKIKFSVNFSVRPDIPATMSGRRPDKISAHVRSGRRSHSRPEVPCCPAVGCPAHPLLPSAPPPARTAPAHHTSGLSPLPSHPPTPLNSFPVARGGPPPALPPSQPLPRVPTGRRPAIMATRLYISDTSLSTAPLANPSPCRPAGAGRTTCTAGRGARSGGGRGGVGWVWGVWGGEGRASRGHPPLPGHPTP